MKCYITARFFFC